MSRIRADQILNGAGTGAPNFSLGLQVGAATTVHTTGIDLGSGNIQSHNINSTGIITATSGSFSGNVSVGGTLTYEDVTNIDSVGIITAQAGIRVTGGKVGIGLTNPLQTFVAKGVSANGGNQYSLIKSDNSSTTGGGGFEIAQNGTRVAVFAPSGWLNSNTGSDASLHVPTGKNFIFYNQTTEALRITSGGALNIGNGTEGNNAANLVEMYVGGTDGTYGTIRGKYNRTNEFNRSEVRFGVESNGDGKGFLAFATGTNSATERLRITADGKLLFNSSSGGGGVAGTYTPVIIQGNDGATLAADVRIRGGSSGYCHSSISLQSTSDSNSGGGQRGLGTYMYDEVSDIEWFVGRPYSGNDYFLITRDTGVNYANSSGQTATHSKKMLALDNYRRLSTSGNEYHFSDRAYNTTNKTSRIMVSQGKQGTFTTCTIIVNVHSFCSVSYDVKLGGYSNAGYDRRGTLYINGGLYGHKTSLNNNGGGLTHSFQYLATQKIEMIFSKTNGFVHPIAAVDVSTGGDGYLDPGDVSIVWT